MIEETISKIISDASLIAGKRKGVIYFNNLGDFYSLCSTVCAAEMKLSKEYVLLFFSDKHESIIKWFSSEKNKIKSLKISINDWRLIMDLPSDVKEQYDDFFVWWSFGDIDFRKMTRNSASDFSQYVSYPHFREFDPEPYLSIAEKGNTIFIIPESNAVKSPPTSFWNFSAELFRSMGYRVIFNYTKNQSLYKGTIIDVPLDDIVGFANYCGYVFSIRCGLIDVLSTSTAKMVIFSTKFYTPIDKIYNIRNENSRINTIFFDDYDLFFEKSIPFCFLNELISDDKNDIPTSADGCFIGTNPIINAFKYSSAFNKTAYENRFKIEPFVNVEYKIENAGNCVLFQMTDLPKNKFRVDLDILINRDVLYHISKWEERKIEFSPEYSGRYSFKATITDRETCNQEFFITDEVFYSCRSVSECSSLPYCKDFEAYIMSLFHNKSKLYIFIASKDAHTAKSTNHYTEILNLFKSIGITSNLEQSYRHSFVAMVYDDLVFEETSENEYVCIDRTLSQHMIKLTSQGFNVFHSPKTTAEIIIDGVDYSINHRGLNIVVWNKETDKLIDSVCFDTFDKNKCYRKDMIL